VIMIIYIYIQLMFLTNKKEGKNSREQCAGVAVVAFLSGIHLS
jgi:hypothetical protein